MKRTKAKLAIASETIRVLASVELRVANGGRPQLSKANDCDTFPTSSNPPPNACRSEFVSDCGGC